jgi:CheY-like chemotaxis protein
MNNEGIYNNDPLEELSNFKQGYYDLIILDMKMQEIDRFDHYAEMQDVEDAKA